MKRVNLGATVVNGPRWLTYGLVLAVILGGLFLWGWVKPFVEGPDLAFATMYRPKPKPVPAPTVKWLKGDTVRVDVPLVVYRDVPAKVEKRLEEFDITLPELKAQNRELVDVLAVPKAPHGGEMAITVNTETGEVDGIFKAKRAPFIQAGGIREVSIEYDPLNTTAMAQYRQDLVRVGPAIINASAFATAPLAPGGPRATYGVRVGVAIRF